MKRKSIILFLISLLMMPITGCLSNQEQTHEDKGQLKTLGGSSEHWKLKGYEIKFSQDTILAGNGELNYKHSDGKITDYASFKMIAIIDGNKIVLQGMKIFSMTNASFNQQTTGQSEIDASLNHKGKKITFSDIDKMYAVIKWVSPKNGHMMRETIHVL